MKAKLGTSLAFCCLAILASSVNVFAQDVVVREKAAGGHWIGVGCQPVPAALRAHLKLKTGVIIDHVAPGAPAAKAGLKVHDIITHAGDKGVGTVQDLTRIVTQSKGKKIVLDIVRGGKKQEMRITPTSRPAAQYALRKPQKDVPVQEFQIPGDAPADLDKMLKQLTKNGHWYRFIRPGVVLPQPIVPGNAMPTNLRISISKEGGKPARITVQKDDKKWDVTEDKLDDLPADVRPHVQRMLNPNSFRLSPIQPIPLPKVQFQQIPRTGLRPPMPRLAPTPVRPLTHGVPADLQKRLEAMEKRLEEIRKSMLELHRRGNQPLPAPKAEKKEGPKPQPPKRKNTDAESVRFETQIF